MSNMSIGGAGQVSQPGSISLGEQTRPASSSETKVNDTFERMFHEGALDIESEEGEQGILADPEEMRYAALFEKETKVDVKGKGEALKTTLVSSNGQNVVHAASNQSSEINGAGMEVVRTASTGVRDELNALHLGKTPPELTLPELPSHVGGARGLKQRFADWVMAKKLDRAGDIGTAHFSERVDMLVGRASSSPTRLIALGRALNTKLASIADTNPQLAAKATLLNMGTEIKWNYDGRVKGLSENISLNYTQRAGLVRQLANQSAGAAPPANFDNVKNNEIRELVHDAVDKRDKFWGADKGSALQKAAIEEQKTAFCQELDDLDNKRREGKQQGKNELGFNANKGGFYYATRVSGADRAAARGQLLKLVKNIETHGLAQRSLEPGISSSMVSCATEILTSDWARKTLGLEAFDALKPIAVQVYKDEYFGRMNKYDFVEKLTPAMNKIMPGNEVWAQYAKNADVIKELLPTANKFLESVEGASNVDELSERKAILDNDNKRTELGELDSGIRRLMNYLSEDTDPVKVIPKACKAYVMEHVPPENIEAANQAIDNFMAQQDWTGLNEYLMKL